MKKIVFILLLLAMVSCKTSSHVFTILGHHYPEYLKCDDCTSIENVKIACDRIMNFFLEYNLDYYTIQYFETEDMIILDYILKKEIILSEYKTIPHHPNGTIKLSKLDCKIISVLHTS